MSVSDAELQERHTRSHEGFYRLFAKATDGGRTVMFDGAVIATLMPILPHRSLPNAVTYRDPSMLEPVLGELAELYSGAGVTAWTVWVPPGDEHLGPMLEGHGHTLDGTPQLMGATIGECDLSPADAGLLIEYGSPAEVGGVNDRGWAHDGDDYTLLMQNVPEQALCYLARGEDGDAIGATVAIHVKGDCYITLVATLPEVRGRGVASDLIRRALRDALEAGCVTTTLEASAMGRSAYRRIGYRDLGPMQMWERRA